MKIPVPVEVLPPEDLGRVHLVGIGGAGLSAIARLLAGQGVQVSGSDQRESAVVLALRAEGITVHVPHDARHVAAADTVIVSTAVPETNPEVAEAQRRGLRLWPRSAGLMAAMLHDERLAVAGTHGKTTTTAMLTLALQSASADVSFAIGAEVPSLGTNARRGTDRRFVVEADESDGAFLHYAPSAAIVTNVDADHLDMWGTAAAYESAFVDFVDTVTGDVIVSSDDAGARRLAGTRKRILTAGFDPQADFQASDLRVAGSTTTFVASVPDGSRHRIQLQVPGRHYATDALLAFALGWRLGYDPAALAAGLAQHSGAARRMERVGECAQISVVDSYAHHPTEIAADLEAGRSLAAGGRLVVVFQPHLVSRTKIFAEAMGKALSVADRVFVADIFLAREDPDPQVSADLVANAVSGPPSDVVGPIAGLADRILPELCPGDLVLTLGAGDVTTVGPALLELLEAREQHDGR